MMGYQPPVQENLFYTNITLDGRVRKNHPLRRINELIDFQFIYKEVQDQYGSKGNVSVPPPVILKLMFLLVYYKVRSERELMETVPERLDWLWFLGYTFDKDKQNVEYAASRKDCSSCLLKSQCTKSKTVRTVKCHLWQDELDMMFAATHIPQAKRDIKTRQHLMERSFARNTRFGFDRSRWRGLWKLSIQEYLVSTIQNLQTLICHVPSPKKRAQALSSVKMITIRLITPFYRVFFLIKEYFIVCSCLKMPKISMARLV